ncbi:MAG TPA: hypothetical protein VF572_04085 [Candidatus Saccharimonadales bacterium]|jgi:uncharacterized protein YpmS
MIKVVIIVILLVGLVLLAAHFMTMWRTRSQSSTIRELRSDLAATKQVHAEDMGRITRERDQLNELVDDVLFKSTEGDPVPERQLDSIRLAIEVGRTDIRRIS